MQKPLTYDGKGLLGKNSITRILPQSQSKNQVVLELWNYISVGSLTTALEFLERQGITGDVALLTLAYLQISSGWKS